MHVIYFSLTTQYHHNNNNNNKQALECEAFAVAQRLIVRGQARYSCNEVRSTYICVCIYLYIYVSIYMYDNDNDLHTNTHAHTHTCMYVYTQHNTDVRFVFPLLAGGGPRGGARHGDGRLAQVTIRLYTYICIFLCIHMYVCIIVPRAWTLGIYILCGGSVHNITLSIFT